MERYQNELAEILHEVWKSVFANLQKECFVKDKANSKDVVEKFMYRRGLSCYLKSDHSVYDEDSKPFADIVVNFLLVIEKAFEEQGINCKFNPDVALEGMFQVILEWFKEFVYSEQKKRNIYHRTTKLAYSSLPSYRQVAYMAQAEKIIA